MPSDRDTYFTPEELRINAECQAREAAYRAVPRPSPLKPLPSTLRPARAGPWAGHPRAALASRPALLRLMDERLVAFVYDGTTLTINGGRYHARGPTGYEVLNALATESAGVLTIIDPVCDDDDETMYTVRLASE